MERLLLSNSTFEGDNNVYTFADGEQTVLVDTGDWTETTRKQLKEGLAEHGITFADIDQILLTHWHQDHTGLAEKIQEVSGASIHAHKRDAPLVGGDEAAWKEFRQEQRDCFDTWHIPEAKQAELEEFLTTVYQIRGNPTVTPFEDGDVFSVNSHNLTAVHAPGHADGLTLFEAEIDGQREVLTSDALLPVYTPNVGGADTRVKNPLRQYLRTLQSIIKSGYDRAWPGHRGPIDDPAGRGEEIIQHHKERAWHIIEILSRRGPCETWTISEELFGELNGVHIIHGPGEVYAHIEHLEDAGLVVVEGTTYRLASGVANRLDEYDHEYWPLEF